MRAVDAQSIKRGVCIGDHDNDNLLKEETDAVFQELRSICQKIAMPLEYLSDKMKEELSEGKYNSLIPVFFSLSFFLYFRFLCHPY